MPFGQRRHFIERGADGLAQHLLRNAGGCRVDGFDARQSGEFLRCHDVVGMHHLRQPAIPVDGARDVALSPFRQRLPQIVGIGMEEGQDQRAGVVKTFHPVRHPLVVQRWRAVATDGDEDSDNAVARQVGDERAPGAIDDARGQVEDEVDQPGILSRAVSGRPQQPGEKLAEAWADPAQAGGAGEIAVKQARAHHPWPPCRRFDGKGHATSFAPACGGATAYRFPRARM